MNPIATYPTELTRAICTMLLNSLWHGLLLAVFAGIVIVCTRRARPALRYNLLTGGLAIFTVASVISLYIQLADMGRRGSGVVVRHTEISNPVQRIETGRMNDLAQVLADFLQSWSGLLVWSWLVVVAIKCIRMATGLYQVNQLRNQSVSGLGVEWDERLQELARQIGLSRPVKLLQSGLAKVPVVIGHLKPVILIPVGLATALSTAEVEAILLHELAHIRRRDYLVNLLQSALEILFFFNPAVLWVSALIRTERENCCDDISIGQTEQKAVYIRALLNCQEFQGIPYALGIRGQHGSLLSRVKRIVSNSNTSLRSPEKAVLSLGVLFALLFVFFFPGLKNTSEYGAVNYIPRTINDETRPVPVSPAILISPAPVPEESVVMPEPETIAEPGTKDTDSTEQAFSASSLARLDSIRASIAAPVAPVAPVEPVQLEATGKLESIKAKLSAPSDKFTEVEDERRRTSEEDRLRATKKNASGTFYPRDDSPSGNTSGTFYPMDRTPPSISQLVPFLCRRGTAVDINNARIVLSKDRLVVNGKLQPDSLHREMLYAFGMPSGTITWTRGSG